MSEALSDIDDTRLLDAFGYGGMRYRFPALQEKLCRMICIIGLKESVIFYGKSAGEKQVVIS
ncbi:hypothetical protein [Psychrobacter sp. 1Y4]|uniref:hypothetical protein n=1 Tax=Psychrobacter sp. 1Y4 TaxID=3453575 RepID=UPI003F48F9A4